MDANGEALSLHEGSRKSCHRALQIFADERYNSRHGRRTFIDEMNSGPFNLQAMIAGVGQVKTYSLTDVGESAPAHDGNMHTRNSSQFVQQLLRTVGKNGLSRIWNDGRQRSVIVQHQQTLTGVCY